MTLEKQWRSFFPASNTRDQVRSVGIGCDHPDIDTVLGENLFDEFHGTSLATRRVRGVDTDQPLQQDSGIDHAGRTASESSSTARANRESTNRTSGITTMLANPSVRNTAENPMLSLKAVAKPSPAPSPMFDIV